MEAIPLPPDEDCDTLEVMTTSTSLLLGARLKVERKKRGLNQTEAADLAGFHQVRWSQLERGEGSIEAILEAFEALGVVVGFTFTEK